MSGAGAESVMPDDLHLPPMFLHRSVNAPVTGREPKHFLVRLRFM
jgi:hypothetical protein